MTATQPWFRVHDATNDTLESLKTVLRDTFARGDISAIRVVNAPRDSRVLHFWYEAGSVLGSSYVLESDDEVAVGSLEPSGLPFMDVRYDPARERAFRHARTAQPLHTDGAGVNDPVGITLFYMERQASTGGESVLIDAESVARIAAAEEPDLFADLTRIPVQVALAAHAGSRVPILQQKGRGWKILWNYYRIVSGQGERIHHHGERVRAFFERLAASSAAAVFRLDDGDALFFHDQRVLHGRQAFTATKSGDRLLWKTYFVP